MTTLACPIFLLLKKPTVARSFLCVFLVLVLATTAGAQEPAPVPALTENDVVARALQRAPLADVLEGAVEVEEGRGRVASAYPNPQFSYTREQTLGTFGTGEDYVSVAQTIDLGNRLGLRGQAGQARARAARREGEAARLALIADARLRFYEVLYRQKRVTALESWSAHVDQSTSIVTRREQRGDVATYDRRRFEREQAVARGRLVVEQAALSRAQAHLQAILGETTSRVSVTGTLVPEADPAAIKALRVSSRAQPVFLALDLHIEAADLDREAASRWWLPDLQVQAGWKGADVVGGGQRADGFVLGASLSIPLWDKSSGFARLAEGEARVARGRRAMLESELNGVLGGVRAEAVLLRRAAAELQEQTNSVSSDLVRITSIGYEGGEVGVLELLDAYRGAADDELTTLDLAHAARRARIELDRLTGAGLL